MKKTLLGVLMMSAATYASAQATVYGVIDTAVQSYDNGTSKISRTANHIWNTSRFGVTGQEDLGQGNKLTYQLEGLLVPSNGTVGSTSTANNEIFNRMAWVGISTSLGEVRIGLDDVSYTQDIDAGVSQLKNLGLRAINGTSVELGTDQKNVVRYISPKINNFTVQLGYAMPNGNGATVDANAEQLGGFVGYDNGTLKVQAGYNKNNGATKAAERDFTAYGVAYDFKIFSVGVTYAEGDVSTTGETVNTNTQVSVRVPLSKGFAAHALYAMADDNTQSTANKGTGYTLALSKDLSKRTTLYAAYSSVDNEANSGMYLSGMSAPSARGQDNSAVTVGISHTF